METKRFTFSEEMSSALKTALAKRDPDVDLLSHLEDVGGRCGFLASLLWISPEIEDWLTKNSLNKDILLGYIQLQGYLHDLGKLDYRFQEKITGKSKVSPPHPLLSLQLLGTMMRPWKPSNGTDYLEAIMSISIATHHSDLYEALYENIDKNLELSNDCFRNQSIRNLISRKKPFEIFENAKCLVLLKNKKMRRTLYVLFNGTLRMADYGISGSVDTRKTFFLNGDTPSSRVISYMRWHRLELYDYQKIVAENARESTIFRLPCGTGKTEAALLACPSDARKVFYTLPTVTTVEAIRHRLEGPPSCGGIFDHDEISYSHHLLELSLIEDDEYEKGTILANRYCMRKVVITTIDRILLSLMNGKHYPIIEIGLNNAYLIVDEIHSYSPFTMALILNGLRYLKKTHNTKITVMSATLPNKISEYLKNKETGIGAINPLSKEYTELLYRSKRRVSLDHSRIDDSIDLALPDIVERYRRGQSVLVVLNTVNSAVKVYRQLRDDFGLQPGLIGSSGKENEGGVGGRTNRSLIANTDNGGTGAQYGDIFLIHSRYNLGDKRDRIAWLEVFRTHRRPLILVATQVVEVSLDLDFDSMFSEVAPVDALVQRCGRVNRKGIRQPGAVHLFSPKSAKPYEDYQIEETKKIVCNRNIESELDFLLMNDAYFDSIWDKYETELYKHLFENQESIYRYNSKDKLLRTRDSFLTLPVIPVGDGNRIYAEIMSAKERLERADERSRKKCYEDYLELRLRLTVEAPIFIIGDSFLKKECDGTHFVEMSYSKEEGLTGLKPSAIVY